ncbi:MAG: 30S ribosomal protein S13 [Candidatus Diapherotrites archaeon]|nr:30S ribosomal protein S13 [Candidatus Diapherotrites archaeon]
MAKKEKVEPKPKKEVEDKNIRGIVRIAGKDLDGTLPIPRALLGIKGIGHNLARSIAYKAEETLGIPYNQKLGYLTEEQSETLEKIILDPVKFGLPSWSVNRRKDYATGKDIHLTGHDLEFAVKDDIGREKKMKSYKGVRHAAGLTVRGQRTKTSGRKGATVGVQRRKNVKGSGK